MEKNKLDRTPDPEEARAGIDRFKVFDQFPIVYNLAKLLNKDFDEVLNLPYSVCFTVLYYESESNDYQKRYSKLLNSKR